MTVNNQKVTAKDIRTALSNYYASPEWYLGFEVGNSTGSECSRHADAVAINAYPSKGFETRGFEIKVSKNDLKSELDNGIKSEEIAKYCDYWFLVVPKGLTDNFTLPPTWGVIEYNNGALRQKTAATKLQKIEPTTGFLCAMLRGRERILLEKAGKIDAQREEQIRKGAKWEAKAALDKLKELEQKLADVKNKTGIDLNCWTPSQQIIDRLNLVRELDVVTRNVYRLKEYVGSMGDYAQKIISAVETITKIEEEVEE